jgi:hypothetical protein
MSLMCKIRSQMPLLCVPNRVEYIPIYRSDIRWTTLHLKKSIARSITVTNRIHLVLLGIRVGHMGPICQPITGSSFSDDACLAEPLGCRKTTHHSEFENVLGRQRECASQIDTRCNASCQSPTSKTFLSQENFVTIIIMIVIFSSVLSSYF